MPSLYELSFNYLDLKLQMDDAENQEQYDSILETIGALQDDIADKGENIARIVRMLDADIAACDVEIKRLQNRKKYKANAKDRLNNIVYYALESVGMTELNTSIGKWKIAKNPPSVEITDEAAIPEEYLIPQPSKVDKHKILDDFKAYGMAVPGVEIVRKESVRFK